MSSGFGAEILRVMDGRVSIKSVIHLTCVYFGISFHLRDYEPCWRLTARLIKGY